MSNTTVPNQTRPNTPSSDTADDCAWGRRLKATVEAEIRTIGEELGDAFLARIVVLQQLEAIAKEMRRETRQNITDDDEFEFEAANKSVERLEYLTEEFSRHTDEFCEEVLAFKAEMDAAEAEFGGENGASVEILVSRTATIRGSGADVRMAFGHGAEEEEEEEEEEEDCGLEGCTRHSR